MRCTTCSLLSVASMLSVIETGRRALCKTTWLGDDRPAASDQPCPRHALISCRIAACAASACSAVQRLDRVAGVGARPHRASSLPILAAQGPRPKVALLRLSGDVGKSSLRHREGDDLLELRAIRRRFRCRVLCQSYPPTRPKRMRRYVDAEISRSSIMSHVTRLGFRVLDETPKCSQAAPPPLSLRAAIDPIPERRATCARRVPSQYAPRVCMRAPSRRAHRGTLRRS